MDVRSIRTIAPLLILIAACSSAPEQTGIEVTDAWSRATAPGTSVGVGYLTITNHGPQADRLVSVESSLAGRVELHESSVDAQGIAQMRPLDGVPLPVGQTVQFEPDGKHLMLVDLRQPLTPDIRVPLTLRFERSPAQNVELNIQPPGAVGPEPHERHE